MLPPVFVSKILLEPTSQWIRLADSQGLGFAESYPTASELYPDSMKYASDGDVVALI